MNERIKFDIGDEVYMASNNITRVCECCKQNIRNMVGIVKCKVDSISVSSDVGKGIIWYGVISTRAVDGPEKTTIQQPGLYESKIQAIEKSELGYLDYEGNLCDECKSYNLMEFRALSVAASLLSDPGGLSKEETIMADNFRCISKDDIVAGLLEEARNTSKPIKITK